jgi:hypothetical protein
MRATALTSEYIDPMRRMSLDDARRLMRHGVPLRAITTICPAPTRVVIDGNDLYRPDPSGQPAWIIPVSVVDPEIPELIEAVDPLGIVSLGPIVDLIAFHPAAPNRWALRRGLAPALGVIEPQCCDPASVAVHRDVTDWLRSGCRGIILLTRDPKEAGRILRQISCIEASDWNHAKELRRLLALPVPILPQVIVARTRGRVAA